MSRPKLIGEIIASIMEDLRSHDMDKVFSEEWTDITHLLKRPSLKGIELQIRIGTGEILCTKVGTQTYARNSDLIKYYGTTDFSIKIRKRNGRKQ